MEPVVRSDEMRSYDRYAIETVKVPGILLMENAGRGVVEMMEKQFGALQGKTIHLYCGKGNNGGDGFVVARHLLIHGAVLIVVLTSSPNELKPDSKANYDALKNLQKGASKESLQIIRFSSTAKLNMLPKPDYIVDALLGTGFAGDVKGKYKNLIEWLNFQPVVRIAIDIPSGVNSDNGSVANTAFKADLTVTMGLKKAGLIVGEGRSYTGTLEIVPIGVPQHLPITKQCNTFLVSSEDVTTTLPIRSLRAHKHTVGKIFILAGSAGLTGAAAMTALSAMKAGAGAVILGTPTSVYPILAKKLTEVMVEPLDETENGSLSGNALRTIEKHIEWADIVVIGPGLSRNPETQELIARLLSQCTKPMLIDADGLNAIAEKPQSIKKRKTNEIILTPHVGELSRIIKLSSEEIEANRIEIARDTAKRLHVVLVLKGAPTVTASPKGEVYINATGNPGMATAGSGDVLSGVIAGLWGQGLPALNSAWAGVFLHGKAGDIAKRKFGEKSLLAMDIQDCLHEAIRQCEYKKSS